MDTTPVEEFTIKTSHYIIGGVAIVTALSWKDTVKEVIEKTFPMPKQRIQANIIYSIIITIILVTLIYILPDTKKELPVETQTKLTEVQVNGDLKKENYLLKQALKDHSNREHLKSYKGYSIYKKPLLRSTY